MQFDQGLGQRQAKAGAFIFAVEVAVDLTELGQGLRNIFGGDADSGVGNLKYEAAVHFTPTPERDLAAGVSELDGVGQQVGQDLRQRAFVGP